jgi:hypothetical protein
MNYSETGAIQNLNGPEAMAFDFIADDIDRAAASYKSKCMTNKKNVESRYQKEESPSENTSETVEESTIEYDRIQPNTNVPITKTNTKTKTNKEILSKESTKKVPVIRNPPTLEEVQAYCTEAGIVIDVGEFLDYYQSTGWKTSGGTPLLDWKSAARNWARRDRKSFRPKPSTAHPPSTYKNADLEKLEINLEEIGL